VVYRETEDRLGAEERAGSVRVFTRQRPSGVRSDLARVSPIGRFVGGRMVAARMAGQITKLAAACEIPRERIEATANLLRGCDQAL
jgi:hypothetical protein